MKYATKINNQIQKYAKYPTSIGNSTISIGLSDIQLQQLGFYLIIYPLLNKGESYKEIELSNFNDETMEVLVGVNKEIEPTAQQLYDELIEQGKIVFDEFRTSLAKAGVNYLLKGDVPQALKDLVVELETTKSNINQVLQLYLSYNNVAKLKAFRFDTPEAEEFKNRIENFK
ncbi:hypothetical protein [Lutibacter maritimus]|uniref:Uncharacterized protein n=1 Tax=Lutibacter maritimus TaxID=593133 RepID=A0A1I6NSL8_9FLAO|nr:hypothetical protein [Lutibacter maritimus]SFS30868.1 hypothetical protein SAMN04488006_0498 [Lutibacter maritimus]